MHESLPGCSGLPRPCQRPPVGLISVHRCHPALAAGTVRYQEDLSRAFISPSHLLRPTLSPAGHPPTSLRLSGFRGGPFTWGPSALGQGPCLCSEAWAQVCHLEVRGTCDHCSPHCCCHCDSAGNTCVWLPCPTYAWQTHPDRPPVESLKKPPRSHPLPLSLLFYIISVC